MHGVWHWSGTEWVQDYVGPSLWSAMSDLNNTSSLWRYYAEYPPGGDMPAFTSMVPPEQLFNPFTRQNQAIA